MKLNKNNFPNEIHRFLYADASVAYEKKKNHIKQNLKSWYQETFQKNNRWNRTQLYSLIKDYSDNEINKLCECFAILFDQERKYNKVFIRYVQEYQEQKELANPESNKLKVDQKTFEEVINYFGDLKRSGKIKNSNQQIAQILKQILNPDKTLKATTIMDRLKNKKGYH